MKKIKNGVFTFITVVVVQFSALAEDPNPGDFGDSAGDPNPTDTPLDTYLWVLLIVSLGYGFYKYRSLKPKERKVS